MEKVAKYLHLIKRNGIWHYNRRVPKQLVSVVGRSFIKQSLKTRDLAEAKQLRAKLDVRTDALFADAECNGVEANSSKEAKGHLSPLSVLVDHLRLTVEKRDARTAYNFAEDQPRDKDELRHLVSDAEMQLEALTEPGHPDKGWLVGSHVDRLLRELGAEIDSENSIQFDDLMRRALIELQRRKLARYESRFERTFFDALFGSEQAATPTLGEIADIYLAEKTGDFSANGVSVTHGRFPYRSTGLGRL